jgi:hypothetical protein
MCKLDEFEFEDLEIYVKKKEQKEEKRQGCVLIVESFSDKLKILVLDEVVISNIIIITSDT